MIATTNFSLIPDEHHPKTDKTAKDLEGTQEVDADPIITVYEKGNNWRSFRQSQLVSVTVIFKWHLFA